MTLAATTNSNVPGPVSRRAQSDEVAGNADTGKRVTCKHLAAAIEAASQLVQGRRGRRLNMARKYSKSASKDVEGAMRKRKRGTLKSGKGGKGGKVKSRKQAIAIGLSEARRKGKKVPRKKSSK
jgi:hypothetical protein